MARSDREIEAAADAFIERVMAGAEVEDRIESLAVSMFLVDNPRGIWDAADRRTKTYWRARAALRDAGPVM